MGIQKIVRSALKALSYPDVNLEKNYRAYRRVIQVTHYDLLKPFHHSQDFQVPVNGHQVLVRGFFPKAVRNLLRDHPEKAGNFQVLLFFHGGGWVTGDVDSYHGVCSALSSHLGRVVLSVDYRLAPECPFPAGLEDCYGVARTLFSGEMDLGFSCCQDDITLIGDSAGGNLAAAVSLMARDRGEFTPKRQILIYPAAYNDYTEASPYPSIKENGTGFLLTAKELCSYLKLYCPQGGEDLQSPYLAPLLAKDLSGQPSTLLITAQRDPLRDEGEAYGRRLQKAGVPVSAHRIPHALHGFFSLPSVFPQVKRCYRLIQEFLEESEQI